MKTFKAYLIDEAEGRSCGAFVDFDEDRLDAGEVTLRVAYSSINYKDALAATGAGRIVRRFPCIGGVDLAGIVESSRDERFSPGAAVFVSGHDIGVAHHGGYAEYARVPGDWVMPLPEGLSLFEAMAIGTAGFTAALAIERMEENGLRPGQGAVIVTGATGGVGGMAIDMLARAGYRVAALTGKPAEADYLRRLGANEVIDRASLDLAHIRPLGKMLWTGAVDNLGGEVLAWLASTMQRGASIASIGLAADSSLKTTVMPFILRGVNLLGIDSLGIEPASRRALWWRLAGELRPRHLAEMTHVIAFDELPDAFAAYIDGRVRGRAVVEVGGEAVARHAAA